MAPGEGHLHSVSITMMYRYKDDACEGGKLGSLKSSVKLGPGGLKHLDLLLATTTDLRDSRVMSGCQTGHYQWLKSAT